MPTPILVLVADHRIKLSVPLGQQRAFGRLLRRSPEIACLRRNDLKLAIASLRNQARLQCCPIRPGDWNVTRGWDVLITVLVPLQAVVLLGWWLYQSATVYAPESWYDPFDYYSVMTCLAQWGTALVVLVMLNRFMVGRVKRADL